MILFISNQNQSINHKNVKYLKITESKNLLKIISINIRSFIKNYEYILIDEELIETQSDYDELKGLINYRLVIFTNNYKSKYPNSKIISQSSDISVEEQIEIILSSENECIEPDDVVNEEKSDTTIEKEIINSNEEIHTSEDINKDNIEPYQNIDTDNSDMVNTIDKASDLNLKTEKNSDATTKDDEATASKENEAIFKDKEIADKKEKNTQDSLLQEFDSITGSLSKKEKNREKIAKRKKLEKENKENIEDTSTKDEEEKIDDSKNNEKTSKIQYDKKAEELKKEKYNRLLKGFKNTSHVSKTEIKKFMQKQYNPDNPSNSIYKIKNENEAEHKVKKEKKLSITLPSIKGLPEIKKKKHKENISSYTVENTVQSKNTEIAVAGGLKGVGTTYCCFKIADFYSKNITIGYYQYNQNDIELSIIKESQEKGYISDNITIYDNDQKLTAYRQNDIVIVDFGFLDKTDKNLLLDFERANEKYIVVNTSLNTFTSVNSVINYSQENKAFKTIFNFTNHTNLISLQKEFKELDIICIE